MKDLMIDLETLGTKPGCTILSIGACFFDRNTGAIGPTFYTEINTLQSAALGLTADQNTLQWWEKQDQDARALLERCQKPNSIHPTQAASDFTDWLNITATTDRSHIWANDPTFDCAILSEFFDFSVKQTPWDFYMERSCRTIVDIGRELGINPKQDMPFAGTKHNALDDAIHQAKYVSAIYQHINTLKKS